MGVHDRAESLVSLAQTLTRLLDDERLEGGARYPANRWRKSRDPGAFQMAQSGVASIVGAVGANYLDNSSY